MAKRYKYAAYGYEDDMLSAPTMLLGRYRWKWAARLRCWWFMRQPGNKQWGRAWVREEALIQIYP